jgi:hypothetical protein
MVLFADNCHSSAFGHEYDHVQNVAATRCGSWSTGTIVYVATVLANVAAWLVGSGRKICATSFPWFRRFLAGENSESEELSPSPGLS